MRFGDSTSTWATALYTYSGNTVIVNYTSGSNSGTTRRFKITGNVTSDMVSTKYECDLSDVTDENWAQSIQRLQCYLNEGDLVVMIPDSSPFCPDNLLFRLSSTLFPGGA